MEKMDINIKKGYKGWLKVIAIIIFFAGPMVIGMYGYYAYPQAGSEPGTYIDSYHNFWVAVYATLCLYAVNPIYDTDPGNIAALVASIWAAFDAAAVIVAIVFGLAYKWLHRFFVCTVLHGKSVAIYSDTDDGSELADELFKQAYLITDHEKRKLAWTKNHVIMFSTDMKSLSFLAKHEDELNKHKNVYVILDDVDSTLLKVTDYTAGEKADRNVVFLNRNELMARDYWSENRFDLYDQIKRKKDFSIGIIGFGDVGKAIFKYGYMNNIYDLEQSITYYIWGCGRPDKAFMESIPFIDTKDRLILKDLDPLMDIDFIATLDRIIITDEGSAIDMIQRLLYCNCTGEIHCYSDDDAKLSSIYGNGSAGFASFGDVHGLVNWKKLFAGEVFKAGALVGFDYDVSNFSEPSVESLAELKSLLETVNPSTNAPYTKTEIKEKILAERKATQKSFDEWIKLNKKLYEGRNFDKELLAHWNKTDGYGRSSSLARADHIWIETRLMSEKPEWDAEVFHVMEHARWCRFMIMDHWTYAPKKNKKNREHYMLVPYNELASSDKGKDAINNRVIAGMLGYKPRPIRNIVFDVGGVLMDWSSDRSMELAGLTESEKNTIRDILFSNPEIWPQEDKSDPESLKARMEVDEWLNSVTCDASKCDGSSDVLPQASLQVLKYFQSLSPENAELIEKFYMGAMLSATDRPFALEWIRELKEKCGLRVYVISNFGKFSQEKVRRKKEDNGLGQFKFLEELEYQDESGEYKKRYLFSHECKKIKPYTDIFYTFLDMDDDLDAHECIFIDDVEKNVIAAQAVGMHGIVFKSKEDAARQIKELCDKYGKYS